MTQRTCIDCPNPISVYSQGRCRSCNAKATNACPKRRAKASMTQKARLADSAAYARHVEVTRAGMARAMQDPAFVESRRRIGREVGAHNIHTTRGPASRAKAGRAISETKLAHIPTELRADYRALIRTHHMTAAEAEAVVKQHAEQEARRAITQTETVMQRRQARQKQEAY